MMKFSPRKIVLLFVFALICTLSFSALMATTDDGRRVVLNSNGTWDWVNPGPGPTPTPSSGINGKWQFSWTLGIFSENFKADLYLNGNTLQVIWHGTFKDETFSGSMTGNNQYQFTGRSFYSGLVTIKATLQSDGTLYGTVTSQDKPNTTATFKATKVQ
ncbi:MAG TPA: hypothetical protein PLF96_08855 [Thermotogota bacterium]|nr:hypothetical protein [Thermotogota bacterium]